MSRIAYSPRPSTPETHNAGAGQAASGLTRSTALRPSRPLVGKSAVAARARLERMQAVAGPGDVTDEDVADLTRRSREDVVAGLSRVLVAVESAGARDDVDTVFVAMLRENIRRYMLVKKPEAKHLLTGY